MLKSHPRLSITITDELHHFTGFDDKMTLWSVSRNFMAVHLDDRTMSDHGVVLVARNSEVLAHRQLPY